MFFHSKKIVLPVSVSKVKQELAKGDFGNFGISYIAMGEYKVVSYNSRLVFDDNPDDPFYLLHTHLSVNGDDTSTRLKLRCGLRLEFFMVMVPVGLFSLFLCRDGKADSYLLAAAIIAVVFFGLQSALYRQGQRLNLEVISYLSDKFVAPES